MVAAATPDSASFFAERLDRLRRSAGLSYEQLARASGGRLGRSTANDIVLRGRLPEREEQVEAWAQACGCSPAEVADLLAAYRRLRDEPPCPAEPDAIAAVMQPGEPESREIPLGAVTTVVLPRVVGRASVPAPRPMAMPRRPRRPTAGVLVAAAVLAVGVMVAAVAWWLPRLADRGSPALPALEVTAASGADTGDVDGDGHGDVLIKARDEQGLGELWEFRGSAGSGLQTTPRRVMASSAWLAGAKMTTTDVNGDGRTDVVVAVADGDRTQLSVGVSNGDGTFAHIFVPVATVPATLASICLVGGDIDGDGRGDVTVYATVAGGGAELLTFRGGTDGRLAPTPVQHWHGRPAYPDARLVTTDVNGDQHADVVLAAARGAVTELYVGRSDPTSGLLVGWDRPYVSFGRPVSTLQLIGGDVNGDGYGDVTLYVRAGKGAGELWTFLGNAMGGLAQQPIQHLDRAATYGDGWIARTDVDGDQRVDFVIAAPSGARTLFAVGRVDKASSKVIGWRVCETTLDRATASLSIG